MSRIRFGCYKGSHTVLQTHEFEKKGYYEVNNSKYMIHWAAVLKESPLSQKISNYINKYFEN